MKPYRKPTAEAMLTRQIRDVLNHVGYFHYKAWQGPFSKVGVADIIGLTKQGRFFAIEVKVPKGKTTPEQALFIDSVNLSGGCAFVARSVEDVIYALALEDRFVEYRYKK
jgi:VRR-NUC domain